MQYLPDHDPVVARIIRQEESRIETSGIRVGSPGITTRGMAAPEVAQIVNLMDTAMLNNKNHDVLEQVSQEIAELCRKFPVYKA
jgi:glycine hydroxymethyltransferase